MSDPEQPRESEPAREPESGTDRPAAGADPRTARAQPTPHEPAQSLREIASGNALAGFLAVVLAVVGRVADDRGHRRGGPRDGVGYIFARPGDFFQADLGRDLGRLHRAVPRRRSTTTGSTTSPTQIRPLTETLKFAGPLIVAGLGVGLAFRAGLFNIGGRGQMLLGRCRRRLGRRSSSTCPRVVHLPLAIVAGMLAGALWAGIAGVLKARTGAHEVIVTIMLNYVGFYLVFYALSQQSLLQAPGLGATRSRCRCQGVRDPAADPRRPVQPPPRLPARAGRRGGRVVAAQPLGVRLPDPRRRREPRAPRAPPASTSAAPTSW